jgi:monoamine oxidase
MRAHIHPIAAARWALGCRPVHAIAMTDYDILVLGAGAAGLAAGLELAIAGRRVAILDARDRLGGRIFTERTVPGACGSIPVELGAEFVHGLAPEIWTLIHEAGLATYELDGSQLCYAQGLLKRCEAEHGRGFAVLERMTQWVGESADHDETFDEYLRRCGIDAGAAESAAAYVEGFNAADRHVIGVAALAKQQRAEDAIEAERIFRIGQGYDALARFMAAKFEHAGGIILLGRPVHKITWRRGAVTIAGGQGVLRPFELHADRAVITLPLGVLQAETVEFRPVPAATLAHARRMAMGRVVRTTLVFRTKFWSGRQLPTMRAESADGACQLSFLFAPGESIPTWWHTHDWSADPYSRGAYSYAPAGALDASTQMAEPVQDTLYFAGEHTDTSGHWGTVHGALRSGFRAADQCLRSHSP